MFLAVTLIFFSFGQHWIAYFRVEQNSVLKELMAKESKQKMFSTFIKQLLFCNLTADFSYYGIF